MSLCQSTLEAALVQRWAGSYSLELFDALGSTNQHLIAGLPAATDPRAAQGCCKICVTDHQTAGVGRRGRVWHSPADSITFSLQRGFTQPAANLMGLSLVCGLAVAAVLSDFIALPIELKWPNDVLVGEKKLAGILVELPRITPHHCIAITGIGVNFADGPEHQQIDQPYTTLAKLTDGQLPDKNHLIGQLAARVLCDYDLFAEKGWQPFASRWQSHDYLLGKPVDILIAGQRVEGIAVGLAADGGLIVQHGDDQEVYYSAEVSVRLKN